MELRDLLAMVGEDPEMEPRIPQPPTSEDYFRGVSPMVENVRPQKFSSMSPGSSFLDNLAMSLAANPLPPMSPNAPQRDRLLGGLLSGMSRGFSGSRMADIQEREKLNETLRQETAQRNQRAIAANERERERQAGINAERRAEARGVRMANLTASLREKPKTPEQLRADSRAETEGVIDAKRAAGIPLFAKEKTGPDPFAIRIMGALSDNVRMDPDVKDFVTVRDNYERINKMASSGNGVGDLSVIFAYMKVLDPTSVVRETEYKNAAEAIGKIPILANTPRNWIAGNKLTPEGRAGFVSAARDLYVTKKAQYDKAKTFYEGQARAAGIDPSLIFRDYSAVEPSGGFRVNEDGIRVRVP